VKATPSELFDNLSPYPTLAYDRSHSVLL